MNDFKFYFTNMETNNINIINQFNEETDAEFNDKCSKIAQDVIAGDIMIVHLIEQLRDLLVNSSPSKRKLGVLVITEVLNNLPVEFLNVHQLEIISAFYTDKLSDQHQVIPTVLKGILTIIGFKQFPGEAVPSLLTAIFRNIACQQQQQADRLTIYTIFQHLLERHQKELISMKLDFIYGVISSIDGERDPRNLLFLFNWLKTFLRTVSLGHLAEEMFEVMACYFPVDFKAPPSESIIVTREDLANALCPCLCGNPEFSEYCITLALEKLDSSLQIAKLDSLKLLREGCGIFDVSSYTQHGLEIWSQIQKVVFSDADDEIKKESLKTLTTVINKMSQTNDVHFNSILKDILVTVKGNLLPDKLFEPSATVLFYIAIASQESAAYMMKEIVPLLTNTFNITIASDKKAIILKTIVPFVKTYLNQYKEVDLTKHEELEAIPLLCLEASMGIESSLRITGFDGLTELAESLPYPIRISLYGCLHRILIISQEQNIRNSILNCFKKLSTVYSDEINEHVLYKIKINNPSSLELYLNALGVIAGVNYFKDIVIDTLLNYAAENFSLAVVAMKNLNHLLERESKNIRILEIFLQKGTIHKFVEYIVTQDVTNRHSNYELLLYAASIFKILIGSQEYETQDKIIKQQLVSINNCKEKFEEAYVFLLDGLLSRFRKALPLDQDIFNLLTRASLTNTDNLVRDTAAQLLANLINKQVDGDSFNNCLDIIKKNCLTNINSGKSNVIVTLSWITKALVMRNHFQANLWIELLLDMLEQDSEVAKGFRIIMNDNYDSLSETSYCNKKLLYRQKCFIFITSKLIISYTPQKLSHLIAVGYLIEDAPEQAILLQFKKILKLVILCLELCSDHEVLCILLNKINGFIINKESVIQENLEDFLTRILTLSTFEHSMKVRIVALQCLSHFTTSFPLYRLLPFKQRVLHQLGICIDDKKRLVRKEAVTARTLWFLLDAPI